MICEKDILKVNKILKEIKSLESKFLLFSSIDISDDCFTDE